MHLGPVMLSTRLNRHNRDPTQGPDPLRQLSHATAEIACTACQLPFQFERTIFSSLSSGMLWYLNLKDLIDWISADGTLQCHLAIRATPGNPVAVHLPDTGVERKIGH
jgi:hypothetical protein